MMELTSYYLWTVTLLICTVVWAGVQKWRFLERLPKGSYGLPLIGETLQFATQTCCGFAAPRAKKYGGVFRTHVFGEPTIFVTNADAALYIMADPKREYQTGFVKPLRTLLGDGIRVGFANDHEKLLQLIGLNLSSETLTKHLPDMSRLVLESLSSWTGKVVTFKQELKKMSLTAAMIFLIGFEDGSEMADDFLKCYSDFGSGLTAFPINLPGFTFHKAVKGRKALHRLFDLVMDKREDLPKEAKEKSRILVDALMDMKGNDGKKYTRAHLWDILTALCLAASESISGAAMYSIKLLHENPETLEKLTLEHERIVKDKAEGEPLSWAEVKKMKYASQVILEAMRLENPVCQIQRRSLKDAEYNGQLFPKDIVIVTSLPMLHSDPITFPNPATFDPSRFENKRPKEFLGFGAGRNACPAQQFTITIITLLLFHMTTKYRFERVGSDGGFVQYPFPQPKDGLRMRVVPRS